MKTLAPITSFLRSLKVELDLVKWPSHQETVKLTTTVIVGTILVGAYIGGLDLLFTNILSALINR